jgi:hypothetical protein
MNLPLRFLAGLVIVAAVVRGGGLLRSVDDRPLNQQDRPHPQEWLGLPADHCVSGLIATAEPLQTAGVMWWDQSGAATAIVPDANGRLRISRLQVPVTHADPSLLAQFDPNEWSELAPPWHRLTIYHWDESAAVYVIAGPDNHPGIAGIDDDGNGSIDDLAELGATGSDDFVVTPHQTGYERAVSGEIVGRLINRGALVPLTGQIQLPAKSHRPETESVQTSTEVWLEFSGQTGTAPQRIALRIRS